MNRYLVTDIHGNKHEIYADEAEIDYSDIYIAFSLNRTTQEGTIGIPVVVAQFTRSNIIGYVCLGACGDTRNNACENCINKGSYSSPCTNCRYGKADHWELKKE